MKKITWTCDFCGKEFTYYQKAKEEEKKPALWEEIIDGHICCYCKDKALDSLKEKR